MPKCAIACLTVLTMLFAYGCMHHDRELGRSPAPQTNLLSSAAQADEPSTRSVSPPTTRPQVPIVYSGTERLNNEEMRLVLDFAARLKSPEREIWGIVIEHRYERFTTEQFITVYYSPRLLTSRIRRASCTSTSFAWLYGNDKFGYVSKVHEYAQYAEDGKAFKESFDPPGSSYRAIPLREADFSPLQLDDRDLIDLIEGARAALPADQPLIRIEHSGDTYRVFSGRQWAPLAGGGEFVTFNRINGRLKLKSDGVGIWAS